MMLRQRVCNLMVFAHKIPLDLAEHHSAAMTAIELMDRLRMYARSGVAAQMNRSRETELSVAGRNTQSGPDFYQVFGSATATARRAALNPVSASSRSERRSRKNLPELEVKNLVRNRRRA
jgi:hypothetical protein